METKYKDMLSSILRFSLLEQVARHNSDIIEKHGFDLDSALTTNSKDTHLMYGSKFRTLAVLEQLLNTMNFGTERNPF